MNDIQPTGSVCLCEQAGYERSSDVLRRPEHGGCSEGYLLAQELSDQAARAMSRVGGVILLTYLDEIIVDPDTIDEVHGRY